MEHDLLPLVPLFLQVPVAGAHYVHQSKNHVPLGRKVHDML